MTSMDSRNSGHLGADVFSALRDSGGRIIIYEDEEQFTAANILERAEAFGAALARHGCGMGSRVILCLQSNTDSLCGALGAWLVGGTPLQVDFRTPASQRAAIAQALDATLVVETRRPAGDADYQSVIVDETWRRPERGKPLVPQINADANSTAFFALSSGTTGSPKIYLQSHGRIRSRLAIAPMAIDGGDGLFLTPMSMSFTSTRSRVLNYILGNGRVHFMPPVYSTDEMIETIHRTGATGCALPPPVIRNMVRAIGVQKTHFFPKLRLLRSSGGPAAPEDKIAAYRYLSPGYCMTFSANLTGVMTALKGEDIIRKPETSGRTTPDVRLEIIDPVTRKIVPPGETGLIKAYTPYLAEGIIQSGISSSQEELGDGWGITGDLGFVDQDGFLTVTGRSSDVILRGGVNVAPQELEAILRRHPWVREVAAVGLPDKQFGQEIALAIVVSQGSENDFHAYCMANIAPERRPRIIRLVQSLPYNANGKLVRSKLVKALSENPAQ